MAGHRVGTEAGYLGQNLVGGLHPLEGSWGLVVDFEELFDGGLQCSDTVMGASLELLIGQNGKPSLDLVEPRGMGWNEVQVEAPVPAEPAHDDRGLVGSVVVHDQVDLEFGCNAVVDQLEELNELLGAVATKAPADHTAGCNVEGRKQAGGSIAVVLRGSSFQTVPGASAKRVGCG